jgi:hypothetical protein
MKEESLLLEGPSCLLSLFLLLLLLGSLDITVGVETCSRLDSLRSIPGKGRGFRARRGGGVLSSEENRPVHDSGLLPALAPRLRMMEYTSSLSLVFTN